MLRGREAEEVEAPWEKVAELGDAGGTGALREHRAALGDEPRAGPRRDPGGLVHSPLPNPAILHRSTSAFTKGGCTELLEMLLND